MIKEKRAYIDKIKTTDQNILVIYEGIFTKKKQKSILSSNIEMLIAIIWFLIGSRTNVQ